MFLVYLHQAPHVCARRSQICVVAILSESAVADATYAYSAGCIRRWSSVQPAFLKASDFCPAQVQRFPRGVGVLSSPSPVQLLMRHMHIVLAPVPPPSPRRGTSSFSDLISLRTDRTWAWRGGSWARGLCAGRPPGRRGGDLYIQVYIHLYTYIYIYIEREREIDT